MVKEFIFFYTFLYISFLLLYFSKQEEEHLFSHNNSYNF
jgi:hypothetical protein